MKIRSDTVDDYLEKQHKLKFWIFILILVIISISLISIMLARKIYYPSIDIFSDFFSVAFLSVSASLIATILVLVATQLIFGDSGLAFFKNAENLFKKSSTLHKTAFTTGLISAHSRRVGNEALFFDLLAGNWNSLDIFAFKMSFIVNTDEFEEAIYRIARRKGVIIRVLLGETKDNIAIKARSELDQHEDLINDTEKTVKSVKKLFKRCKEDASIKSKPMLRQHKKDVYVSIFRVDDTMIVYHHLPTERGKSATTYCYERSNNGPFFHYLNYFETLWNEIKDSKNG